MGRENREGGPGKPGASGNAGASANTGASASVGGSGQAPPARLRAAALALACAGVLAGSLPDRAWAEEPPFDLGDAARIEAGRLRYGQTCAGYCHGGGGVGGRAPNFLGRGEIDAQRTYATIERGRKGPGGVMPRWGDSLSPEQIWELVAYLKYLGAQPAASQ